MKIMPVDTNQHYIYVTIVNSFAISLHVTYCTEDFRHTQVLKIKVFHLSKGGTCAPD